MTNKQLTKFQEKLMEKTNNTANNKFYNMCKVYNPLGLQRNALDIFCNNLVRMNDEGKGYNDKYWHSMANCQSAQKGYLCGALGLSLGKEVVDYYSKTKNGGIPQKVWQDSMGDLRADFYGFGQGILHPFSDCSNLVRRYWKD